VLAWVRVYVGACWQQLDQVFFLSVFDSETETVAELEADLEADLVVYLAVVEVLPVWQLVPLLAWPLFH